MNGFFVHVLSCNCACVSCGDQMEICALVPTKYHAAGEHIVQSLDGREDPDFWQQSIHEASAGDLLHSGCLIHIVLPRSLIGQAPPVVFLSYSAISYLCMNI